jgi:hypothetical protein
MRRRPLYPVRDAFVHQVIQGRKKGFKFLEKYSPNLNKYCQMSKISRVEVIVFYLLEMK